MISEALTLANWLAFANKGRTTVIVFMLKTSAEDDRACSALLLLQHQRKKRFNSAFKMEILRK
jgi:hypothetical protein